MINVDEYLAKVEKETTRPPNFCVDMKSILSGKTMRYAISRLIDIAAVLEKQFITLDLSTAEGVAVASKLQGQIVGINLALGAFIELANEEKEQEDNA